MPFFEKYDKFLSQGRASGRPVGVKNGQGTQPMAFENPMLKGMAQTQTPMSGSGSSGQGNEPITTTIQPMQPAQSVLGAPKKMSLLDWATGINSQVKKNGVHSK